MYVFCIPNIQLISVSQRHLVPPDLVLPNQTLVLTNRAAHRYEVNPEMVSRIEEKGLLFVGRDETGERMEVVELQDNPAGHPFYVAAQVCGVG
jgi:hypothetical protein